jgi:ADP-ribose pyrophosphatase YjhB (NUDIX family)
MVAFDKEKARFNYRVAGVAIQNGRILLDRNSRNSYWVLPGGHPEMMESMTDALRREVREEIGVDVEVVRLLWIMENFFHKNKDIHELSFYFQIQLPPASPLLASDGPFYGKEHDYTLTFQWYPIDEVSLLALPLYPSNLAAELTQIPEVTHHLVFHDEKKSFHKRLTIS